MGTQSVEDNGSLVDQQNVDEMTMLGIVRVPVDYFHYRNFRYTNLADAIAQAKRDQRRS